MTANIEVYKRTRDLVSQGFESWRDIWLNAAKYQPHSYFFSWPWVELWLSKVPLDIEIDLIKAQGNGSLGACLLGHAKQNRHLIVNSDSYFLHYTGHESYDSLTLEYNQMPGLGQDADLLRALLKALPSKWDEFHLPALDGRLFPAVCLDDLADEYRILKQKEVIACHVDLSGIDRDEESFIVKLSPKTRRNIRRSMRKLTEQGPLRLQAAGDLPTAMAVFDEMVGLHQVYWQKRGHPGAFANEWFTDFHKTLIERRFDAGEIQLLHILCGEQTLGCIYNFVYQGVVYHYQNGFNYERFSNSPGIVSLALAIPYNAAQGHKIFDFMAGDSEYKRSLSTDKKMMQWYVIQQKRLQLTLEQMAQKAKARLRG